MRFRTGLILGVLVGYFLAAWLRRSGSAERSETGERGRRLVDLASVRAAAIRRAGWDLRRRLEASAAD